MVGIDGLRAVCAPPPCTLETRLFGASAKEAIVDIIKRERASAIALCRMGRSGGEAAAKHNHKAGRSLPMSGRERRRAWPGREPGRRSWIWRDKVGGVTRDEDLDNESDDRG